MDTTHFALLEIRPFQEVQKQVFFQDILVLCTGVGAHTGWPSECLAEERYNNNNNNCFDRETGSTNKHKLSNCSAAEEPVEKSPATMTKLKVNTLWVAIPPFLLIMSTDV